MQETLIKLRSIVFSKDFESLTNEEVTERFLEVLQLFEEDCISRGRNQIISIWKSALTSVENLNKK